MVALAILAYGVSEDRLQFDFSSAELLAVSLLSDIVCLAAVRWTIRRLTKRPTIQSFLIGSGIQLAIITVLVVLPFLQDPTSDFATTDPKDASLTVSYRVSRGYMLFGLNTVTGIVALSFLAVLLFMTLHKLFWPAASRILHPLTRFQLIRNRKLMIRVGIACSALISPPISTLIDKIFKLF